MLTIVEHYHVKNIKDEEGMKFLKDFFNHPPDDCNFVLFSTSGVHGSYTTIEEVHKIMQSKSEEPYRITFLLIQPRAVAMFYGNCIPENYDDINFLLKLRSDSWKVIKQIGEYNANLP